MQVTTDERALAGDAALCLKPALHVLQVETFKKLHGEDQMAVDKLKEGIDGFAKDQVKLEAMVHEITEGDPSTLALR